MSKEPKKKIEGQLLSEAQEKELAKQAPVPGIMRGAVENVIHAFNNMDFNDDGKADLGQIAAFGAKSVPAFAALNAAIDFEKLAEIIAESKAVKDKEELKKAILMFGQLAEEAEGLLAHEKE